MYKLGYTAGAFDLFHVGHLKVLRAAKSLCEHLTIAVSTDELIKKVKKKTPIVPFADRCEILRSIKYVDSVIPQNSMDKTEAYYRLKYDVLFVGDDHYNTGDWDKYEDELRFNECCEIVYLPYTISTSTTKIIKRIKNG